MTGTALIVAAADAATPLGIRIYLAVVLAILSGVLFTMGRMGARRTLRPNALFGIRTRRTMSSDEIWYEAHALAAPWSLAAGFVALIGVVPVLLLSDDLLYVVLLLSVMTSTVILVLGSIIAVRQAAETVAKR